MKISYPRAGGTMLLALAAAACSSTGSTSAPSLAPAGTPSLAPAGTVAVASAATSPSGASASAAGPSANASGTAVEARDVGSIGTVLVAGSNGMTVYTFAKDTKDNGKSACSGGCATKWPALTVASEAAATGGPGATGKLGTIKREDDGKLQVTYNGLPLYFFQNDKAPGDANGVYENWAAVKP